MVFDWAYQLVEGNRELKRMNNGKERKISTGIINSKK